MDMNIQSRQRNYVQMDLFVLYVMNHKCARQAHQASIQIAKDQPRLQNVHRVNWIFDLLWFEIKFAFSILILTIFSINSL